MFSRELFDTRRITRPCCSVRWLTHLGLAPRNGSPRNCDRGKVVVTLGLSRRCCRSACARPLFAHAAAPHHFDSKLPRNSTPVVNLDCGAEIASLKTSQFNRQRTSADRRPTKVRQLPLVVLNNRSACHGTAVRRALIAADPNLRRGQPPQQGRCRRRRNPLELSARALADQRRRATRRSNSQSPQQPERLWLSPRGQLGGAEALQSGRAVEPSRQSPPLHDHLNRS